MINVRMRYAYHHNINKMQPQNTKQKEQDRAHRISIEITENHHRLDCIYENLIDRDFKLVERNAKLMISDLRIIIKSLEDDDF